MKKHILMIILSITLIIFTTISYFITTKEEDNTLTTIKLAEVTHSVFYTPLYIGIENGYFKEEGINIELILAPGADKTSAAVLSGDANIGLAGTESAIYIYEGGEKDYLQVFSGLTKKDGQFIVSKEPIENFKLEDLYNNTILAGRSSIRT